MIDPTQPDFQDRPLPWVAKHEYVLDAHRGVIADLDPGCDRDEARACAVARFIAAAPETAERLRELVAAAAAVVAAIDAGRPSGPAYDAPACGYLPSPSVGDAMTALRAALARARGGE